MTTVGALHGRLVPGGTGGSSAVTVGVPLSVRLAGMVIRTHLMSVWPGETLRLVTVTVKLVGVPTTAVVGLMTTLWIWRA